MRKRILISVLLVSVSAAVALFAGLRGLMLEARATARRAAETKAESLRQRLTAEDLVDGLPEEHRVRVEGGRVVVPYGLKSLDHDGLIEEPVQVDAQIALLRAEIIEHREGNGVGAAALLARSIDEIDDEAALDVLHLRRAWILLRRGATEEALFALEAAGDVAGPSSQVSRILLGQALGRPALFDAVMEAVPRLSMAQQSHLAERLTDLGDSFMAASVRQAADRSRRVFARHREVDRRLIDLAAARSKRLIDLDSGEWLLWVPRGAEAFDAGLATPAKWLALAGVDESERLLAAADDPNAISVLAGCSVPIDAPAGTTPLLFGMAALVLAALGGGLVLALRAFREEAHALQVRQEFVTAVTHELRTPMASISALVEMITDNRIDDQRRLDEYLGLLANESMRLSMLIENVLDLGRLKAGNRGFDFAPIEADSVLTDVARLMQSHALRGWSPLLCEAAAPGVIVICDRRALTQALTNLVDNAIKYSSGGDNLVLRSWTEAGRWVAEVKDFGPGVQVDEREKIFDRFVRGSSARTMNTSGLGLGLHLARGLIRAQGGNLTCIEPPDGLGACFRLDLPSEERDV